MRCLTAVWQLSMDFEKSDWFQLIHQLILLRTELVALMGESVALMRLPKEDRSQLQHY